VAKTDYMALKQTGLLLLQSCALQERGTPERR